MKIGFKKENQKNTKKEPRKLSNLPKRVASGYTFGSKLKLSTNLTIMHHLKAPRKDPQTSRLHKTKSFDNTFGTRQSKRQAMLRPINSNKVLHSYLAKPKAVLTGYKQRIVNKNIASLDLRPKAFYKSRKSRNGHSSYNKPLGDPHPFLRCSNIDQNRLTPKKLKKDEHFENQRNSNSVKKGRLHTQTDGRSGRGLSKQTTQRFKEDILGTKNSRLSKSKFKGKKMKSEREKLFIEGLQQGQPPHQSSKYTKTALKGSNRAHHFNTNKKLKLNVWTGPYTAKSKSGQNSNPYTLKRGYHLWRSDMSAVGQHRPRNLSAIDKIQTFRKKVKIIKDFGVELKREAMKLKNPARNIAKFDLLRAPLLRTKRRERGSKEDQRLAIKLVLDTLAAKNSAARSMGLKKSRKMRVQSKTQNLPKPRAEKKQEVEEAVQVVEQGQGTSHGGFFGEEKTQMKYRHDFDDWSIPELKLKTETDLYRYKYNEGQAQDPSVRSRTLGALRTQKSKNPSGRQIALTQQKKRAYKQLRASRPHSRPQPGQEADPESCTPSKWDFVNFRQNGVAPARANEEGSATLDFEDYVNQTH